MGLRARETAAALGWDRIVAQIESVFLATLAAGADEGIAAEAPNLIPRRTSTPSVPLR
jgi:hypothetical protein